MVTAGQSDVEDLPEHPPVDADALVVLDLKDGTSVLISEDVRRARPTPSQLERRLLGDTQLDHPTKGLAARHSRFPPMSRGAAVQEG